MPILRKEDKSILFVHIPKTGGGAVESVFLENDWKMDFFDSGLGPSRSKVMPDGLIDLYPTLNHHRYCSPQHLHYEILSQIFRIETFDYSFTIIRNPSDRLQSEYRWQKRGSMNLEYNEWVRAALNKYERDHYAFDNHLRPQNAFWGEGVEIFCIEDDIEYIFNRIQHLLDVKIKLRSAPRVHRTTRGYENLKLTEENVKRVEELYEKDAMMWMNIKRQV